VNPAQKNRVRAALLALNKAVRAVEETVDRDGAQEPLYRWNNRLSPADRAEATRLAAEIRAALAKTARAQELESAPEDPILSLASRLAALWVELEEAKAKALRAYGPAPAGLEKSLDPALDELGRLSSRLQAVLSRSSRSSY
jgi:outer membrane PBP1 activator LpoA protein